MFTSDIFLDAFSPVINGTPVYGKGMWIRHGPFINRAEGSAWNLFRKDLNVTEMIEIAKSYNCWFLRFTGPSPLDDDRLGRPIPTPTLLTFPDFTPKKTLRWSIRKAEKAGFTTEPCSAAAIQPLLDQLWTKLGRGIPQRFYEILEKAGIGKALVARMGEQVCSGLYYLTDEDNVWYLYSLATGQAFRSSEVTSLLVYSFIKQAFEKGAEYVDLCGSSIPSIAGFKRQFASKEHNRPTYEVYLNPLYPIGRRAIRVLRSLRNQFSFAGD